MPSTCAASARGIDVCVLSEIGGVGELGRRHLHNRKVACTVEPMKFSDQVRAAIEGCGISRYLLAQETGVTESSLSRFVARGDGLSMANLDKLADFLRFSLEVKGLRAKDRKRLGVR